MLRLIAVFALRGPPPLHALERPRGMDPESWVVLSEHFQPRSQKALKALQRFKSFRTINNILYQLIYILYIYILQIRCNVKASEERLLSILRSTHETRSGKTTSTPPLGAGWGSWTPSLDMAEKSQRASQRGAMRPTHTVISKWSVPSGFKRGATTVLTKGLLTL